MVEAEKTATLAPASCDALPSPAVQGSTSTPSIVVTVGDDVAQVATPSAQLTAATVGSPTVHVASLQGLITSLKLPLEESLITSPRAGLYRVLTTPCSSQGTVIG